MKYKAYTLNLGHSPQSVTTDILVSYPLRTGDVAMPGKALRCKCKWDTGSNITCITHDLFHRLNIPTYDEIIVKTPHGTSTYTNTAKISIGLPNGQIVPDVEVCVANMVETDVLIGMDIITMGDFSLTRNKFGEVIFSICMPHVKEVDFRLDAKDANDAEDRM